ncbi:Protein SMAX1-LIKE 3 [Bienertia sinuspersici]
MRSQGCTIQQALTQDAAAVVKQAVALAKRRGHAQVTPLHVAHTMLAASSGLLRAACLQSHAHPLQCRALELCFNVALNRLPTSASGPMLGPHSAQHHHPSIANALVAAFKRAQAHQRRGSIENQQQPLLAVKIELEQLIISILDDPSVSRVMREAGFSSPLVKAKVEQAVSMDPPSDNTTTNNNNSSNNIKPKDSNNNITSNNIDTTTTNNNNSCDWGSLKVGKPRLLSDQGVVRNEDLMSVIESLTNKKKRNSVIVGECLTTLETLVRGVMDKVEKGEVPEILKQVKFIHLSFASFGHLSREEVEQRVEELKCHIKTCCKDNNKGVILYLDDLKWVNEFRASNNNILVDQHQPRRSYYCPIEHMIIEIGKLAYGYTGDSAKLWLLGIATFQTYMRCKSGQPSLEVLWCLHAITIPAGSLGLSLVPESDVQSPLTSKKVDISGSSWLMLESGGVDSYRSSGTMNMESQSRQTSACNSDSTNSSLPSWLQQYKDENSKRVISGNVNNNDQEDTWLFFQGVDIEAKEKIARELARLIFGSSHDKFVSIGLSSFSSTRVTDHSMEDFRNKRLRDEQSCSYIDRFVEAVSHDPHRVFFVEDIEQVDYCSQMGLKKAIERGQISKHSSGEEVSFGDAIIILSCEKFSSRSRACSPSMKQKVNVTLQEDDQEMKNIREDNDDTTISPSLSLDLNISINDDDDENEYITVESQSMDEIGLLASVDRCIAFNNHQHQF